MGIAAEDRQLSMSICAHCGLQKGLSEHTTHLVRQRSEAVRGVPAERAVRPLQSASSDDVRAFLAGGEWRPSTRARKTAACAPSTERPSRTETSAGRPHQGTGRAAFGVKAASRAQRG